jgi:hypothetical protein
MSTGSLFTRTLLAAGLLALVAGCSSPGPRERSLARLAVVEQAAGEPVDSFRFWNLQRWEALGPDALAVWTRFDQAYLLRVDGPCTGLEYTSEIALSSNLNRVTRRFDTVSFDRQSCRIAEIRPIDARLLSRAAD